MSKILGILVAVALFAGCTAATSDGTDSAARSSSSSSAKSKPSKPKPSMTVAQKEAVESAQSYVDTSGFSRAGLLEQLTSKSGEGFKRADALYAVNHINVDWNAEAVEAAKSYLSTGSFSRASLIEQLTSSYGDGFTRAQALYAVKKVGL